MNLPAHSAPAHTSAPAPLYRIGVDGGGSSTRARLALADGSVLGEGQAGASGLVHGHVQAWQNIQLAIQQAVDHAVQANALQCLPTPDKSNSALGIGIAGFNNAAWRAQFLASNPGYSQLAADTDAFTALLGAHQGRPGALVIAGTGTVALALHADGTRKGAGGWGFPSGDDGGGAIIGMRAVNLAQHAADGLRPTGALVQAVLHSTGNSADALLDWCCAASQSDFATLAPLVFDCEDADPVAAQLLREAVQTLEQLAAAIDPDATLPLALWGSIGLRLASRLAPALQARLVQPQGDALDGALTLTSSPRSPA
ncbi:BadF/BadG/BcrA/BcrD ATPase family protein [Rhodoferax sp.]|uniref:BadF/BadG/BcrA/BcrD ATPase family protein n=1 Tax=Rhodoferax sp. TaxID=50421 RepID=UPI00374D8FE7